MQDLRRQIPGTGRCYRSSRAQVGRNNRIHHEKGIPMQRVEIGRYPVPAEGYAGYIEGTRDDGTTWIMYLDQYGSPELFWPTREETGAVVGDPIKLPPLGPGVVSGA